MASGRRHAGVYIESFLISVQKGLDKNMGDKETVVINGKAVGKEQLLAQIEAMKKPYDDVEAARQDVTRLVNIRDAAEEKAAVFAEALEAAITSAWGTDPQVKARYGVPPPKNRRELTVVEKLQMVAKSQETRTQRGTMGKRQKAKIKATGEVSVSTTLHPPGTAAGNANGTQPSANPAAGGAPGIGATNVVAGPPSTGGTPTGGLNVMAAGLPARGATNVVAGPPSIAGTPTAGSNVMAAGVPLTGATNVVASGGAASVPAPASGVPTSGAATGPTFGVAITSPGSNGSGS